MQGIISIDENWPLILHELGLEPGKVAVKALLPGDFWSREPMQAKEKEYIRLHEAVAKEVGEYALVAQMGNDIPLNALEPSYLAAACCSHFNDAVQLYCTYKKSVSPFKMDCTIDAGKTTVSINRAGRMVHSVIGMLELVKLMRLINEGTKRDIQPLQVCVPQMPDARVEFEDFFGIRLIQSNRFEISFTFQDATHPFITANNQLLQYLQDCLNKNHLERKKVEITKK